MTLSTQTSKTSFAGNGVSASFPLPFPFLREADIKALLRAGGTDTPLLSGTHYTLEGAGQASGGTLTMLAPPATGQTLVIWRAPALVQEVDYVENSAFPAETHEAALDLLTMICQSLQEQVDRAVLYPVSAPAEDILAAGDFLDATVANRAACASSQTAAQAAQAAAQAARVAANDAAVSTAADRLRTGQDRETAETAAYVATTKAAEASTSAQSALASSATASLEAAEAQNAATLAASYAQDSLGARDDSLSAAETATAMSAAAAAKAAEADASASSAAVSAASAAAAAGGGVVKASGSDATTGTLSAKLLAGDGLSETINTPGGAESMTLAVALAENPGLEFATGLLRVKASTGLALSSSGLVVDMGTTAGKIVQLDANGKLPALPGDQLTGIGAVVRGYTRQQYAVPVALGTSGSLSLDAELHQDATVAATGNVTFANPTNPIAGEYITLTLSAASALTIGWGTYFYANSDVALPTAFVAGKTMLLTFRCLSPTMWLLLGKVVQA